MTRRKDVAIQIGKHNPINYRRFRKEVREVVASGIYSNSGSKVKQFESKLKSRWALGEVNLVTNGTLAIEIALRILARKYERHEAKYVVTTPFTHASTVIAIKNAGYSPIFIDIEEEYLTLNPEILSNYLKTNLPLVNEILCILPVHAFNNSCDVDSFKRISEEFNLPIIYDAAHSIGCKFHSESILSMGSISCVSLHATKSLSTGEGGLVIVNDNKLFGEVNMHRNFGITVEGQINFFGTNGKVSEFSASVGMASLTNLDKFIRIKKKLHHEYNEFLSGSVARTVLIRKNFTPNYNYYPIVLKDQIITNKVIENLKKNNIGYRRYFAPSLDKLFNNSQLECPVSNSIAKRIICLPTNYDLSKGDIRRICLAVTEVPR
jgi:dTDP-4-amino-4,6-dideoxygalactose transaminase